MKNKQKMRWLKNMHINIHTWDLMILWWSIQELRCCEEWDLNAYTGINCQKYTWQCVMPLRCEKMNFTYEMWVIGIVFFCFKRWYSLFFPFISTFILSLFSKLFSNYYTALTYQVFILLTEDVMDGNEWFFNEIQFL
jgi:hypothetical protein